MIFLIIAKKKFNTATKNMSYLEINTKRNTLVPCEENYKNSIEEYQMNIR